MVDQWWSPAGVKVVRTKDEPKSPQVGVNARGQYFCAAEGEVAAPGAVGCNGVEVDEVRGMR